MSNNWVLDPSRFPQRLDLELSERTMDAMTALSARLDRPLRDVVADLLAQAVAEQDRRLA